MAAGPDGNLWFTEFNGDQLGRITTGLTPLRFTDPARIEIPKNGTASGAAAPYPTTIEAEGLEGTVTDVSVRLNGLHHPFANDVEVMLVGPQGQSALLLADIGGGKDVLDGEVVTFRDGAPDSPPRVVSGIFAPFHPPGFDTTFPARTHNRRLREPRGVQRHRPQRRLEAVHQRPGGDEGVIAGGWSLDIQTTGRDPIEVPGPTTTVTVPGPTVTVPGPTITVPGPPPGADTTRPTLTVAGLATRVPLATFRRGVTARVTPSEPVTLDATLSVVPRRATVAQFLALAERTTNVVPAGTRLRLRPSARLLGRPKRRFRARLRLVATDRAGNRATVTRTITVTPGRRRR